MAEAAMNSRERHTLAALRYAITDEAASYLAIMRLFTDGMSGFLPGDRRHTRSPGPFGPGCVNLTKQIGESDPREGPTT